MTDRSQLHPLFLTVSFKRNQVLEIGTDITQSEHAFSSKCYILQSVDTTSLSTLHKLAQMLRRRTEEPLKKFLYFHCFGYSLIRFSQAEYIAKHTYAKTYAKMYFAIEYSHLFLSVMSNGCRKWHLSYILVDVHTAFEEISPRYRALLNNMLEKIIF